MATPSHATGATRASTCCTRSAGTPSACPPRTPPSSAASTRARWTYENIEQQKRSFRQYAPSFDWSREIHTSDPEYYKWNQWLFLKLYEKGLAYRKAGLVNWCPNDQTVLANEQVLDGHCERCGLVVKKKASPSGTSGSPTTPTGCSTT